MEKINQRVLFLLESEKLGVLKNLISLRPEKRILVFSRTKYGADKVVKSLSKVGVNLSAIHGNKSQLQRQKSLDNFKRGKCFVLVATDIASRGLDIKNIEIVVNYDLPDIPETYIHRIGRTARAGAFGQAISFCASKDRKNLTAIENMINMRILSVSADFEDIDSSGLFGENNSVSRKRKTKFKKKIKNSHSILIRNSSKKKHTRSTRSQGRIKSLRKAASGEMKLSKQQ